MRRKIFSFILLIFLITISVAVAQDETSETAEEEAQEETISVRDQRRQTLRFGTESQVISVIGSIRTEKDDSYYDELLEVMNSTGNSRIIKSLLDFMGEMEYSGAEDIALRELNALLNDEDYSESLILSAISYLGYVKSEQAGPLLYDLLSFGEDRFLLPAIRAIGKVKDSSRAEELIDMLNEYEYENSDIAANIILTLGEIDYKPAIEYLLDIVSNIDSDNILREYGCQALGQLGDERAIPVMTEVYNESTDSTLRSYAIAGLAFFEGEEIERILLASLTRDDYWKIRVNAAAGLAERNSTASIETLIYKAEFDEVDKVRFEAINSLTLLNDREGNDFLIDRFLNEKAAQADRLVILQKLVENQIAGTVDAANEIFDKEWDNDSGRFLEFCCREIAKGEWNELSILFRRMLSHENDVIQVYGIRGIEKNDFISLYPDVAALDREGESGVVRREAREMER